MLICCGNCRKRLNVEDGLAGEVGLCPACKTIIRIPKPDGAATTNQPPPEALPIPEDELRALRLVADSGSADGRPPVGAVGPTDLSNVPTDEQGYVLAVPVEDEPPAASEIPGQGVSIPRPTDGEADQGYGLADEPSAPAGAAAAPPDPGQGLSDRPDNVLGALDGKEDTIPFAPAGAGGVTTGQPTDAQADEKVITRCPGCNGLLAIESQYAGKMRTCPKCQTEIQVPLTSTVVGQPPSGAPESFPPVPSALAEDLAPDVDLEDYVAQPVAIPSRGVASYWLVLAFLVGATIGFVVGWMLSGTYNRPAPRELDGTPPAEVTSAEPGV